VLAAGLLSAVTHADRPIAGVRCLRETLAMAGVFVKESELTFTIPSSDRVESEAHHCKTDTR